MFYLFPWNKYPPAKRRVGRRKANATIGTIANEEQHLKEISRVAVIKRRLRDNRDASSSMEKSARKKNREKR